VTPLPVLWVNGERQPPEAAHVSALDRGLTLADGLFETMRVRHGTVFRLDRHLARLRRGLDVLEIPAPPGLRDRVLEAVRVAGEAEASVRITVTRGVGAGGVAPSTPGCPTTIIALNHLPVVPAAVYERGLTAHVASGRRNEHAVTSGLKTLAYTEAVAALLEAQHAGADEALFLDTASHCSEASASNLFMWTSGALVTPPISCGALPGITRATVVELAAGLDLPIQERAFSLDELLAADEAFLTSSLRGLAPLVRVSGHPIGGGTPGRLSRRLMDAYATVVEQECGAGVWR
jgi:branched-chain amino acid aminotransferase